MGTVSEKTMVRNNCFVARRSWGRERKFSLETPEFIKQQTVGIARVLLRQQKKKKKKKGFYYIYPPDVYTNCLFNCLFS